MKLKLTDIREDPEVQLRAGLDMDRVKAMVEYEENGGHLPPITVVGDDNLLGDGHHRLEAARMSKKVEIEAERIPGGKEEAIVAAIQKNDISAMQPLTRTQRNEGVKYLLKAGWTQERIASVVSVDQTTIMNIHKSLAARGQVKRKPRKPGAGRPEKATVALPKAVHERLGDTMLVRIATLPEDQQLEFAVAVAAVPNKAKPRLTGLTESRVREAIKLLNAGGLTPTQAVEMATPQGREVPSTLPDVAKQVRKRLERFLTEPMTIEGEGRDFWSVIDVLAHNATRIPLEARGLATLLSEVAVKADHYATALRSGKTIEVIE